MQLNSDFIKQIQGLLPAESEALLGAITGTEPSVSIRVNPAKTSTAEANVPWCRFGHYLKDRMPFTFDTDFQTGRYYVQDASSMFIHHVIEQLVKEPVRYLDLCAAPGGKTTTALSALPEGSLVVGNEIMPARARVLRENILKWGCPNAVVTNNAPKDLGRLTHFFDVIATDVPCSGEGMMRKDEEARNQWTPALVKQCADLQHSIIDDIWPALKPGGLLIYSTCTYNRQEDEQMVAYIVERYGAESVEVPAVEAAWNIHSAIDSPHHCYRFMPHRTQGEGLFMAVLRKPADEPRKDTLKQKKQKGGKQKQGAPMPKGIEKWLKNASEYVLSLQEEEIIAIPKAYAQEIAFLQQSLHVLHAGVAIGTVKGKNCVPSHALALSTALNADAFTSCEVAYPTAMAYMRGEAITLADAPRGYVLLTHGGHPIGFANNLGNRANNLYPKPWRILSTHLPTEKPQIL